MKSYALLFFLAFFLIGCEQEEPTVDRLTFILEMEKNMIALEKVSAASEILVTKMSMWSIVSNNADRYLAEVMAHQEELDYIVLEAKMIPPPKDSASQEIYQLYLQLVTDRRIMYQRILDAMINMDLVEIIGLITSIDMNDEEKWERFETLWIAYKANEF